MLQDNLTPLLLALRKKNRDLVTMLVNRGADINAPFANVRNSSLGMKQLSLS